VPLIDVTAALTNPYTLEKVTVVRRKETVDTDGFVALELSTFSPVFGVIAAGFAATMSSTNDLMRRNPDYDYQTKSISFVTKFRLRGVSKELNGDRYKGDILIWPPEAVDQYLVTRVEDYSRFGRGFVQSEASAIDLGNTPPGTYPVTFGDAPPVPVIIPPPGLRKIVVQLHGVMDGVNLTFPLPSIPLGDIELALNGSVQIPSIYSISGTNLVMTFPPQAGDVLVASYIQGA
jgi:hypothetical protein